MESIRGIPSPRYICFEESTLSEWMYELLEPLADKIQVIQPPQSKGVKNDITDAYAIAEIVRLQPKDVTQVYKNPRAFTALRKAVRAHCLIQADVVRAKNRIHASYRARGLKGLGDAIYDPEQREELLHKLPPAHRRMTEQFCVELDGLTHAEQQAEQWMLEEARAAPVVKLLSTAPGIGTIRASQIVATVLSPHRFRTSRQLWAYSGLGIIMRSSSDYQRIDGRWQRTNVGQNRGLNRNRNALLKNVFKGAAMTIASPKMAAHPLHQDYQRLLDSGTKPNLAKLTIARRIAAAVLAMWKNNQEYDATKQTKKNT
jgi:transposase